VLLVNLLAALNFANVFLKIKNVWKIKNVKNVKRRFLHLWPLRHSDSRLARQHKAKFHYTGPTGPARTLSETRTDPPEFLGDPGRKKVRAGPVGPV